jgi:DNA-binding beta-propeller fold protein YncE
MLLMGGEIAVTRILSAALASFVLAATPAIETPQNAASGLPPRLETYLARDVKLTSGQRERLIECDPDGSDRIGSQGSPAQQRQIPRRSVKTYFTFHDSGLGRCLTRLRMTRHVLAVLALLCVAGLAAPPVGHAQTFKVEKFDIKGDGGTDYVTVEPATGRVFVSRSTHMMVVEGATGKVLGDIPNTPGVHGAGIVTKVGHGFTTNSGDQTVTMFDLKTLAVIKQIKVGPGLDGIMYDQSDDKIILTNHSRPIGTLTAIDPTTGDIVATVELEDTAPEGAAADGKGHIFVNNEGKNTIQVIDVKTWKATSSWPLAPCEGPTGIAYDKASNRIFSGCSGTSVVLDANTGKVVASITNGTRVDALGWDPSRKLIYIPNGGEGNVTVVHQDSADKYTVVATVPTFAGAKTITVDPVTHNAYLFQPERGPAPPPAPDAPPPPAGGRGRGRGPQGPIVAAWFIVIRQ